MKSEIILIDSNRILIKNSIKKFKKSLSKEKLNTSDLNTSDQKTTATTF